MTTLPAGQPSAPGTEAHEQTEPLWKRTEAASHFRNKDDEFDACKLGMWLFLTTEVLLFAGIFVAYGVFRMLYPEAWAAGSKSLGVGFGLANTIILLISSFTVAAAIRDAQLNRQFWLKVNLLITIACGFAFLFIKFFFEYSPKWADGKRPGAWFDYPYTTSAYEPLWWGVYYVGTGIHAAHVIIGMGVLFFMYLKARKKAFGPTHYTGVEIAGLYWHLVDVIWIFLFPLLYLVH